MIKFLNGLFFKGLIVVLPVTLTLYLLITISSKIEGIFAPYFKGLLGPDLYIPGIGIIVTILAIMGIGVLVSNFVTGSIINFFTSQFEKVPFIKAIYNPLKDLMKLFGGSSQDKMQKVVAINFEALGVETLGLVTREEFADFDPNTFEEDKIAVYIPMSYMLGGHTVVVSRSKVREVNIPVDRAFKLALTAWIKSDSN